MRVLHLSFHRGCINEFNGIGKQLGFQVDSWFIPDLPGSFVDGKTGGNALYNMTHERAERIWNKHRRLFEKYDAILVSDTAPLARIFLQNQWQKPLIIWICNRFDYVDNASLDGEFPDPEYYALFNSALKQPNVFVIPYTQFEQHYAKTKGVDIKSSVIAPCYPEIGNVRPSDIPSDVVKQDTVFLPPYHNETKFMVLSKFCDSLGIKTYCGRYSGPSDVKDFKAIIHLPYNWSNLAFFENIRLGIPYFVPSQKFLEQLLCQDNYFHADMQFLREQHLFHLSEWYAPEHSEVITYFDSWEDLKDKMATADFEMLRKKTLMHGLEHYQKMFGRWSLLFQEIEKLPRVESEEIPMKAPPFVIGRLDGQLGNQFFIIAATLNLALSNNAKAVFPDFINQNGTKNNLKENFEQIFSSLDVSSATEQVEFYYMEPEYTFVPIPYYENMEIRGWFQSEKYFKENKEQIIQFFSPSNEIVAYLRSKYADIIDHPNTVSIHFRSYDKEDPQHKVYADIKDPFYENAVKHFSEDALFVVFSPDMEWCKSHLSHLGKNIRFIENEKHYHDMYLMSMCKNNIICNSTFSWWSAYLNKNPEKKVIAPAQWFAPSYNHDTRDLIPKEWMLEPIK